MVPDGKGIGMKSASRCYKGAWMNLVFAVGFGALLWMPVRLMAQATPTPEASSPSDIPAQDANTGTVCDLSKNSSDGLAIISVTMPPREREVGFPESFRYVYKPKDAGWLHNNKAIGIGYFHAANSDFSAVLGKLYVLRLPAGAYEFQSWEYQPLGAMNGTVQPFGIHPLAFNVASGRAVYLGGLDPTIIEEGRNLLHQKTVEAWVLVHDDSSRDLPTFFNKCPGFDRNLLDIKVMDTSPWLPPKKK
jgi:hypothetical protein